MRTLNEILSDMKATFVANSTLVDLYGLDSSKTFDEQFSTVSIEAIILYVCSVAIWAFENVLNTHKSDIDSVISSRAVCSIPWYYQLCMNFQLGYALVFKHETYSFGYSAIDSEARIISFVAIRQIQSAGITKLRIYVSKSGKQPLNTAEIEAFTAYINSAGAAGTHFEIVSQAPTPLEFTLQVTRDPQVLNLSGQLLSDSSAKPVELAISGYLDNIVYGAVFNRTKLVDAIQNAAGVNDVILTDVRISGVSVNSQNIEATGGAFSFDPENSLISYTV